VGIKQARQMPTITNFLITMQKGGLAYARAQTLRLGLTGHFDPHKKSKIVDSDTLPRLNYYKNACAALEA